MNIKIVGSVNCSNIKNWIIKMNSQKKIQSINFGHDCIYIKCQYGMGMNLKKNYVGLIGWG